MPNLATFESPAQAHLPHDAQPIEVTFPVVSRQKQRKKWGRINFRAEVNLERVRNRIRLIQSQERRVVKMVSNRRKLEESRKVRQGNCRTTGIWLSR